MIGMKETTLNNGIRCPCRPVTSANVNSYLKNVPKQKCFCSHLLTLEESKTKIKCHPKKIQEIKSNITINKRIESSNINVRCCTANRNGLGEIEPKTKCSCDDYKSDAYMLKVVFKLIYNKITNSQIIFPIE